jgi:predicted ATP-dependent protease
MQNSRSQELRRTRCSNILQALVLVSTLAAAQVSWGQAESVRREQIIPILAVTTGERAIGTVVYVVVAFEERIDQSELQVTFQTVPGRFSGLAQTAIQGAVLHTARSLNLLPNSWNVVLTVPYPNMTIGGDSLAGMVALTVAALAQGLPVPSHMVLTGTITPDGSIAPVGAVLLKLGAANTASIRRVLISDQEMVRWTPGEKSPSMQVLPIRSVREAFHAIMQTATTP